MTVAEAKPPDHARVLVNLAGWTSGWYLATAHHGSDGLRWRFDHAGWMDAHPNDEWAPAPLEAEPPGGTRGV